MSEELRPGGEQERGFTGREVAGELEQSAEQKSPERVLLESDLVRDFY